jgi:hypothetical protein
MLFLIALAFASKTITLYPGSQIGEEASLDQYPYEGAAYLPLTEVSLALSPCNDPNSSSARNRLKDKK